MTKAELEKDRDEWKRQAESLQDDLDALNEAYYKLECELADMQDDLLFDGIKDLSNLKYRLQMEGLLDQKLENFLEEYIKFYND